MTATVQPESKSSSRRTLLAGALGGLGVWAASTIGRASPVRAEGQTIVVGGEYTDATTPTHIGNADNNEKVFWASSNGSGIAVDGSSSSGIGVRGNSNSYIGVDGVSISGTGVRAFSLASDQPATIGNSAGDSTGVMGCSGSLPGAEPKTGVYGYANQDSSARGVVGKSPSGIGVYGFTTTGYALQADGRVKFSTSGVATIAAGSTSVLVSPGVDVTADSFVLVTPKADIGKSGLWFTADPSNDTFTIHMSSKSLRETALAWLLLG